MNALLSSRRRIALVCPANKLYLGELLQGAARFAREAPGLDIRQLLYVSSEEIPERVAALKPHGAVFNLFPATYQAIQRQLPKDLVQLNIGVDRAGPAMPGVCTGHQGIVAAAVHHLREKGYQQLALVSVRGSPGSRKRAELLRGLAPPLACFERELPLLDREALLEPDDALTQWLSSLALPVGIITWSGPFAHYVRAGCWQLGLEVPQDVGILSLDNSSNCLLEEPAISAVELDAERIGYEAVKLLADLLEGKRAPGELVEVPPRGIHARASTQRMVRADVDHIRRALLYIQQHACEGIQVSDVVKATQSMSRGRFYAEFQKQMGQSPGDFIRRQRITAAQRLLDETALTVTAIAGKCGFDSVAQFGKTFRKRVGQSPREYRAARGRKKGAEQRRK